MINSLQFAALTPAQRTDLIHRQARSELAQGLWRAALGEGHVHGSQSSGRTQPLAQGGGLEALLAVITEESLVGFSRGARVPEQTNTEVQARPATSTRTGSDTPLRMEALGPNGRFADAINEAAERTGLPAAAIASIIDAEAGRGKDGAWNVQSRNPRSSAAGLGQFLSGTWKAEAERPGTWLHAEARRRDWLNSAGQVTADARSALLALRYDPEASIQATADYARGNLQRLERAGLQVAGDVESVARAAYLGHHLGPGDAAKFLSGGLDPARARRLLDAQVGKPAAAHRLARADNAADAHREWLNAYLDRRINPGRFG